MKIVLIGPPGSGKGTQALRLKDRYHVPHISSGDVLRKEVAEGTELGKKIAHFMEKGEIGPVELITETLLNYLDRKASGGFILDGFPRTMYQAEELEKRHKIDAVFFIHVSANEIVERILGRRICKECGMIFHLKHTPPSREGICDRCGAPLTHRSDDTEATILNRIRVYNEETFPLLDFYERDGMLSRIDGERPSEEIFKDIKASLDR